MAIDSIRLLTDSAAQLWPRLAGYGPIDALLNSSCYDEWLAIAARSQNLPLADQQLLRRDYRRMCNLIDEIETLVRSRSRAIELVQARIAEEDAGEENPQQAAGSVP
jgi:hypothetical protein